MSSSYRTLNNQEISSTRSGFAIRGQRGVVSSKGAMRPILELMIKSKKKVLGVFKGSFETYTRYY